MANSRLKEVSVKFGQGQPTNLGGRKKLLQNLLKDYFIEELDLKLSKSQIIELMKSFILKTETELTQLESDNEQPYFIKLIIKALKKDALNGRIDTLKEILDRGYGKSSENIQHDVTTNVVKVTLPIEIRETDED